MINFFIKWSDRNQLLRHTEPHHRKISWTCHRNIIVISWTNTDFRPNGRGCPDGWSIICRILGWTHSSAAWYFSLQYTSLYSNTWILYWMIKFLTKPLISITKWLVSLPNGLLILRIDIIVNAHSISQQLATRWTRGAMDASLHLLFLY